MVPDSRFPRSRVPDSRFPPDYRIGRQEGDAGGDGDEGAGAPSHQVRGDDVEDPDGARDGPADIPHPRTPDPHAPLRRRGHRSDSVRDGAPWNGRCRAAC
ncbi:hypothetical protein GCM10010269_52250 [Streptomyces humidus]|uniref:Uncharacterized protein n=1 Tax=Streptomyces humidus TaxID=52259 RepID=A0A918G046_9ACTN|nr:hypothetical protein GCM10010269_52250 [Streptomyces humidus]